MVNGRKVPKGCKVIDCAQAYFSFKKLCMANGQTELMAAINGACALEQLGRDCNPNVAFAALTDLAMKAIPDIERLEPTNPEDALYKEDFLAMYRKATTNGNRGTKNNLCGLTGVTSKDPFTLKPGLPCGPLPPCNR